MRKRQFLQVLAFGMVQPDRMIRMALKGVDPCLATPSIARLEDMLRPDIVLEGRDFELMLQTVKRLQRLQVYVGYGNFNLLGFDQALRLAKADATVCAFTNAETNFLEAIFFADATRYGFMGDKVSHEITETIHRRDIFRVPNSSHYLFKGESLDLYLRVKKDVGSNLILTSGVRGIVKQTYLFLSKALAMAGNLSQASRHLAPPGHSYHGVGDFDIGKRGFGLNNFSDAFADTEEYKRLLDLDYVHIRYPQGNPYGVRYEPWHIRVAA
jgi:hypothetical protein